MLPVCVTSDADAAKARADAEFGYATALPSYRSVMGREGATATSEVAFIGDEEVVARQIRSMREAGATDFVARLFGTDEDQQRTLEALGGL